MRADLDRAGSNHAEMRDRAADERREAAGAREYFATLESTAGTEVVLGVRPEPVALEERPGTARMQAQVELREVLGSEALLHLAGDAGRLTVRADAHGPAREGDSLAVWLDPAKLHVFDAVTDRRL